RAEGAPEPSGSVPPFRGAPRPTVLLAAEAAPLAQASGRRLRRSSRRTSLQASDRRELVCARPSSLQRRAFGDLLLQPTDKALRIGGRIAAGAKRVVPLRVGEVLQALANPPYVGGCNVVEERGVTSAPVELHAAVDDALDERRLFEHLDIAARWVDDA